MTGNTLILDFDGVIVNSINECLLTSYNAYQKFENTGFSTESELSNIPSANQKYFYLNRKYVRHAGEYYLLHFAYANNLVIKDDSSYKDLLTLHKKNISYYQAEFFKERHSLRMENNNKWLGLHRVYSHLADSWKELKNNNDIFIVSNKDKLSIVLLMDYFSLSVNEDNVFGAENGNNKSSIIKNIIEKNKLNSESVYFVDDNLDNLISTIDLKIKLYLAMWGYGNLNENDNPAIEIIYPENVLQKLI